ncbi:flotillin family protein [soil metagenome]
MDTGIIIGGAIAFAVFVLIATLKNLIVIVPSNRLALVMGRRTVVEAHTTGFRVIRGGRTLRVPFIEEVHWLPLHTMQIMIDVREAPSKGYIPLNVKAVANVKIASSPDEVLHAASERLLGLSEDQITRLAEETLTANLRGVLSTMTPEEVNEDRDKFATEILSEAEKDLQKMGFHLDTLKIQHIGDNSGYLEAVGRVKTAEVIKNATVAEAQRESETRQRQAEARQAAEVAEAQANLAVADAQNLLRVRQAELDREAETAEKTAVVSALREEAIAQHDLEQARIELQRRRLQADIVEPAEARRKEAEQNALADAASIREDGRAQAEVLRLLFDEIRKGGEHGFQIFMAEKLPDLFGQAVDALKDIDVDRLVVFDGGSGDGLANAANQRVNASYLVLEQLAQRFGLDFEQVLRGAVKIPDTQPVPVEVLPKR